MQQLSNFFNGFKHAVSGICSGFKEASMVFHGLATILVLSIGLFLRLTKIEWFIILILVALVWSAELFNTAIEELADIARQENGLRYNATRRARDLAAGAVLVISVVAAIIGSWIFLARFLKLINC